MGDSKRDGSSNGVFIEDGTHVGEISRIHSTPRVPVTEKIIFCLDNMCMGYDRIDGCANLISNYMVLKRRLSVNDIEFSLLYLITDGKVMNTTIVEKKDLVHALQGAKKLSTERESFDFSHMFESLAKMVELPDSSYYGDAIPPPFVYHVILLFGHNLYSPSLNMPNAFHFLMSSPYFSFDVLYLYDLVENNLCERISKFLALLCANDKGYFVMCKKNENMSRSGCMVQFLGHPLIRFPQNKAKFNLIDLFPLADADDLISI